MLRNGDTARTARYVPRTRPGETEAEMSTRRTQSARTDSARHESWQSYDNCVIRRRNEGRTTVTLTSHYVTLTSRYLTLPHTPSHYLTLTSHSLTLTSHYLTLTSHYLTLPHTDLTLPSHYLILTSHYLTLTSHSPYTTSHSPHTPSNYLTLTSHYLTLTSHSPHADLTLPHRTHLWPRGRVWRPGAPWSITVMNVFLSVILTRPCVQVESKKDALLLRTQLRIHRNFCIPYCNFCYTIMHFTEQT